MYWKEGRLTQPRATLEQTRDKVKRSLDMLRSDHKRNLNPTPYKVCRKFSHPKTINFHWTLNVLCQVAVSDELYSFIHQLWLQNAPIGMFNVYNSATNFSLCHSNFFFLSDRWAFMIDSVRENVRVCCFPIIKKRNVRVSSMLWKDLFSDHNRR